MLPPPDGLRQDDLRAALTSEWGLTAASMTYLPVGFGSHHWQVADSAGGRWFVTVDELDAKRVVSGEPVETAFGRLSAALATAVRLKDCGAEFVVAPVPSPSRDALA